MEELFISLAEKSVVGAGFFYMLYYQMKNMEKISTNLNSFGCVLQKVSETLIKIDMRVEQLERRIQEFEGR